jgi:uncharacterized protein YqeY
MSLLQKVKDDQLAARKAYNALSANLLTTLIGEAAAIGKNDGNRETTDIEVIAIIKKFISNLEFNLKTVGKNSPVFASQVVDEMNILKSYLPRQMTDDEVRSEIELVIANSKTPVTMALLMGHLKTNYGGLYNGQSASGIVKSALESK